MRLRLRLTDRRATVWPARGPLFHLLDNHRPRAYVTAFSWTLKVSDWAFPYDDNVTYRELTPRNHASKNQTICDVLLGTVPCLFQTKETDRQLLLAMARKLAKTKVA